MELSETVQRNELKELDIAARMGAPDVYIDSRKDFLWYHWLSDIYIKPLRFENRSGTYVIALKTDKHTELGKHRHRGEVKAYTVRGNWGLLWVRWNSVSLDSSVHAFYIPSISQLSLSELKSQILMPPIDASG